jgi:hypothetical protein
LRRTRHRADSAARRLHRRLASRDPARGQPGDCACRIRSVEGGGLPAFVPAGPCREQGATAGASSAIGPTCGPPGTERQRAEEEVVTGSRMSGERLPAGPSRRTNRRPSHGQDATQDRLERIA